MTESLISLKEYQNKLDTMTPGFKQGKVLEVVGNLIRANNIGLSIGDMCEVFNIANPDNNIGAEVVGFKGEDIFIMPLGNIQGLGADSRIRISNYQAKIPVGPELLGRIFDGNMQPLDNLPPIKTDKFYSIYHPPPNPMHRRRIQEPLDVGIRAINGLLTIGKGQRIAILAGSGVGKSVLLGMMGRHTKADVNVIGLIGERGREIKEFLERDLGKEGLKKSVIIAATSDQSPLVRIRAAMVTTAIAEYFREQGKDVLLMMDSLTRFAMAQREIGLSIGEPPTTKGYPPSVFTLFPRLLERVGNSASKGSISSFYTVLIEGDDPNDPIGDIVRSIVDGHIILDRNIASRGHYPAIDILNSKSRLMRDIITGNHWQLALKFIQTMSTYAESEDLINIGAYVKGSNPKIDFALNKQDFINSFLRQNIDEYSSLSDTINRIQKIFNN